MPVVFNLSSWAVKRKPITEWLVEELNTKYQVPRKLGRSWVDSDQVLPLLNGLDEVALEHRAACLDAINANRQEHGILPMVVCSRSIEYLALMTQMLLHSVVTVQPLTEQQIDDYLASAGGQLAAVRVALRKDKELQELATTPLVLSVLTLAYQGKSVEDLLTVVSPSTQRRQVFEAYVLRMLQRRGTKTRYTAQQTIAWPTYLAKQQVQHSQTEFYLERMHPYWLPGARSRILYRVVTGLVGWLVCGLIFGLIGGLIFGLSTELIGGLDDGLNVGLIVGAIFGPAFGLFEGGDALIQHFALRWFLWREGSIPWKYAQFLDYAADRILLRKVGGGYIFVHRLLLEYFASLDTTTKSSGVSEQP